MRKIPRLGLLVGLLLAGALVVAALPATVLAGAHPIVCYGDVTLDGAPAPAGTEVNIYLDGDLVATTEVAPVTPSHPRPYWVSTSRIDDSRYGDILTYTVDGYPATKLGPDPGVFGPENQEVDLEAFREEPPQVTTTGADPVNDDSATVNGNLVDMGDYAGATTVRVRFNWGTTFACGTTTNWKQRTSTGPFTETLPGLAPSKDYYFKAQAQGLIGGVPDGSIQDGDVLQFTTLAGPVWPAEKTLVTGWNVISTPVWLDSDSDTIGDIISGGYSLAYRWTGTSFINLASYYVWKPLEAFYIKVTGTATATFNPLDEMQAPNKRTLLGSNRWYLVGSSPDDGTSDQTMDVVLAGLAGNYSNVVKPDRNLNDSGDSCAFNTLDPCTGLTLPAFGGAWVFVGSGTTKTIVGFCATPLE